MKEKRKPSPRAVLAIIVASVMILTTLSILGVIVYFLFDPLPYYDERRGLEHWRSRDFFAYEEVAEEKTFLSSYPTADADYYYDYYQAWFYAYDRTRSLAFLTYDDPDVYAAAKQSRLDYIAGQSQTPAETEAFGFSFCSFDDIMIITKGRGKIKKILDYEAFGYNDATRTLVFIRFDARGKKDKPYMELANTDYEAFIAHFYGEWFDWERGVGIHLPE